MSIRKEQNSKLLKGAHWAFYFVFKFSHNLSETSVLHIPCPDLTIYETGFCEKKLKNLPGQGFDVGIENLLKASKDSFPFHLSTRIMVPSKEVRKRVPRSDVRVKNISKICPFSLRWTLLHFLSKRIPPCVYRVFVLGSLNLCFCYHQHPFTLSLDIVWHVFAEVKGE